MKTKIGKTYVTVSVDESGIGSEEEVRILFMSYDTDSNMVRSSTAVYFTGEEFREFRSAIRDFYTAKEQEEHFAMMSQRDNEAPDYTMTDMMVDKGSI